MTTIERHEVEAWLGEALEQTSQEQVAALLRAWQDYEDSPAVIARSGEAGDYEDEDRVVTNAIGAQILGDDVGLEALGGTLRAAKRELYLSIAGAVRAGMSEAEAARRAGVNRMTVRRLLGKR